MIEPSVWSVSYGDVNAPRTKHFLSFAAACKFAELQSLTTGYRHAVSVSTVVYRTGGEELMDDETRAVYEENKAAVDPDFVNEVEERDRERLRRERRKQ